MNWLYFSLPILIFYIIWYGSLFRKKEYDRPLLFFALAHIPYLLVNLVAPFRGLLDPDYVGYNMGLLQIPRGIWVTVVVGTLVIACFLISTQALRSRMARYWKFAFILDLFLLVAIALPVSWDVFSNLSDFRIELGEYVQIAGIWTALIIFGLFTLPTLYSFIYVSGQLLKSPKLSFSN